MRHLWTPHLALAAHGLGRGPGDHRQLAHEVRTPGLVSVIEVVAILVVAWLCFLGGFVIGAVFASRIEKED